jgi:UDP-N-acetylmuramoyl-L-alanyl-D-glutamate--2,6-diaminopimelate ligase
MTLRDLLGAGPDDVEITGLAYDNRAVRPGTLFFCVPGFTRDGHDFAPDAVARGAAALVVCRPLGLGVPEVQVEDMRAAMAHAAARFYGDPTAQLRVVGITGTSGKTTSAWLTRAMLEAAGMQTGLLGTVTSIVGGESRPVQRTTPEAIDLQRTFREMLDAGDVACAMEISSHALELRRAEGIHCTASVFTNLSQDHLDFHPDMESYFLAKRKLFEVDPGVRIACSDDEYGRRLAREFPGTLTFGIEEGADIRALDVRSDAAGSTFTLHAPDGERPVRLALPGRFNVLNALGAWAAARALGAPPEPLLATLTSPPAVPGRFEPVDEGQPFTVVVDYAHKPGALENVLVSARAITGGRVIVVFGAGGDRDRAKRPLMGEIGARLADLAIITSDNPRSEDPEAIVREVAAGVREGDTELEVDRRAAIGRAVGLARPGDIVVIAGKGHEQGQEFEGGRKEPFDDVAVAREALHALKARA